MEDPRNVKWILIISLILFFVSFWFLPTLFGGSYIIGFGPQGELSLWNRIWVYVNRVDNLLFITTLVVATLFTSGYAKERTYTLTIYLFIASMGLFFISFLRGLF